ncbi:polysaccharide deacetylase family protein [Nakamurella sp. PAMC28650]|uniref:polysaccharide deacetylase family protein n=1 Tax=Nakamurella sp. PAMC28650 TaxID=2762325 RepID=UPI001C9B24F7|nr:polysaccharide deacetylase family protein [Nakamurella sp. PAMC28650]
MTGHRRRRTGLLLGGGAVVGASAYWSMMSPFSRILGRYPFRGSRTERVVALTFDDGPNEPYTSRIADVLAAEQVRATFFQVGLCVQRHPEVTARLVADGHVIGNHSYSHRFTRCLRPAVLRAEITATQDLVVHHAGVRPALYRPPWLMRIPALQSILGDLSLQPVLGQFGHAFEVFQPSPRRIARRAAAKARPGSILIFHDGFDGRGGDRANTAASVKLVIDRLRDSGYRFVTLDEMLGVPAYQ